jgi:hypothetical protein
MAQSFFDVEKGFQIDSLRTFTSGTGDPTVDEPIGSLYLEDDGTLWQKRTAGAGVANWRRQATEDFVNDAIAGRTWRDPARAKDDTVFANLAAAEAQLNGAGTFDGVTVVDTNRILFTAITGENKNVFIVNGTPGAGATLVEDTNLASDGDALWVQEGSINADTQWFFDGTDWVQTGAGDQTELAFIRAFIGKGAAGSETPIYSSNNFVTDTDSLETAIGDLDAEAGLNRTDTDANTAKLADARTVSTANNVTGVVTLDSVNVDLVASVKWFVYAQGNLVGDAPKKRVVEIHATHDGHLVGGGADAANTDFNTTSKLKLGTPLGTTYDVDLSGAGGSQVMRLRVAASTASDFKAIREVIKF